MNKIKKSGTIIFIVEDNIAYQKVIERIFLKHKMVKRNFKVYLFENGDDCLKQMHLNPDIIILDYFLDTQNSNKTGLQVLKTVKIKYPNTHVIMLSSNDDIEIAINSVQEGAYDYITKSETAFIRLEKKVKDVLKLKDLEKEIEVSRKTNIFALFVFLGIFGLFFILNYIFENI